jgi:hypothetical protein
MGNEVLIITGNCKKMSMDSIRMDLLSREEEAELQVKWGC